jgi:hypothetical protein
VQVVVIDACDPFRHDAAIVAAKTGRELRRACAAKDWDHWANDALSAAGKLAERHLEAAGFCWHGDEDPGEGVYVSASAVPGRLSFFVQGMIGNWTPGKFLAYIIIEQSRGGATTMWWGPLPGQRCGIDSPSQALPSDPDRICRAALERLKEWRVRMRSEGAFTSSFAILWRILQLQFQPNDPEACLRAFGALLNAG